MFEIFTNNWQAFGGTALLTMFFTYIGQRKLSKLNEESKETETEGQGIKNLDKILELNSREIDKLEIRFKEQLEVAEMRFKMQLEPLNIIISEQKRKDELQTKIIAKLEMQIYKYKAKYGELM